MSRGAGPTMAARWLDSRPHAPPALRARIERALATVQALRPGLGLPELLAEAALECLRDVLAAVGGGPGSRNSAADVAPSRPEAARPGPSARRLEDTASAGAGAPAGRASAVNLLAADALLTYACEAAAEAGPAGLEALARDYGPDRLAGLLPEPT